MEQGFIDILQKLIAEQGKEALLNASKCKAFLADYTKNEYKKESRLLLQALEAGVQKAIDTTDELEICKKQQVRTLNEDYDVVAERAVDVVDTLAYVLRGDASKTEIQSNNPVKGIGTGNTPPPPPTIPGVEPLMKRGYLFLEDADWKQANEYFDRVLDMDPEYAPAYIGKLCADLKVRQEDQLAQNKKPLANNKHYEKAIRFADANYQIKIEQYDKAIKDRIAEEEKKKKERERKERERIAEEERQRQKRIQKEKERMEQERKEVIKRGYETVPVPGGSFQMGDTAGGGSGYEKPVHTVRLDSFNIGKYQVTQELYEAVMGNNPCYFKGPKLPVENVSWYDAVEFCNKLSGIEELQAVYTISGRKPSSGYPITDAMVKADWGKNGYRLPTEAEWEYAAKGGERVAREL